MWSSDVCRRSVSVSELCPPSHQNWPARGGRLCHSCSEAATGGVLALTRCSRNHHDEPEHQPSDVIDRDACMGSGNCLFWAPGVFDLDDDGVAVVCGDMAGREEEVRKAAANCPTAAIHLAGILPS